MARERRRLLWKGHRLKAASAPGEYRVKLRDSNWRQCYRYSPGLEKVVYKLRLLGVSEPEIADCVGCGHDQLRVWRQEHPSFAEAWRKGGEMADAEIANALYRRAKGYKHKAEKLFYDAKTGEVVRADYIERYPPETGAAMIWLANRKPKLWRPISKMEVSGPDGQPLQAPSIHIQLVAAANAQASTT